MSASFFIYTQQKLTLPESLAVFTNIFNSQEAIAILYSPQRCVLAKLIQGELCDDQGQPVEMSSVFEARIFNETAELRWLNDPRPEKHHRTVILTEYEQSTLGSWQLEKKELAHSQTQAKDANKVDSKWNPNVITKLNQTYLLWGEGTGKTLSVGWSELATARIGSLLVPVAGLKKNQRVLLHSVEYIVAAEHGNAVIFDERLTKLEVEHG